MKLTNLARINRLLIAYEREPLENSPGCPRVKGCHLCQTGAIAEIDIHSGFKTYGRGWALTQRIRAHEIFLDTLSRGRPDRFYFWLGSEAENLIQ